MNQEAIPQAFVWRRLHSFMGIWLTLYLILHLLTNSQAALFFGDDGAGFVEGVKAIHNLPYLPAIEIFLLGVPFAVHIIWGVKYALTARPIPNSSDGSSPAVNYPHNKGYTWQRITSWILLFAIIAHVIHMRFLEYPVVTEVDGKKSFMVRLDVDKGLYTVADRLQVTLYDEARIQKEATTASWTNPTGLTGSQAWSILEGPKSEPFDESKQKELDHLQEIHDRQQFVDALRKRPLDADQVIAVADNFGTASLLMVRETFKMPLMVALYSLFVIVACFHAFNGLWTFLITWGVTLTPRSQTLALRLATLLMILVSFLGLAAAIGTYWINLKY